MQALRYRYCNATQASHLYYKKRKEAKFSKLTSSDCQNIKMIQAHTKLGKTIREVIKEFGICRDTYYYWYHRYEEKGIFGLFDSKGSPKTQDNKTRDDVVSRVVETADCHPELDAPEILQKS